MKRPVRHILDTLQAFSASATKHRIGRVDKKRLPKRSHRLFSFEGLEPRIALAAAGLVPIGTQPEGPLSGKIVYTSGGHGWQWSDTLNRFATDRGDNNEIVEDFGNQEQMTYYVDYLLRAGATVVPMRPVGRQINEVVLDNDSAGVTFAGAWSDSSGSRYYDEDYGVTNDAVSYRFATTNSGSETAVAAYTPNIPEEGFYPVYTWVAHGGNRTAQLYKINHTGGQTQIRVDHSMVGNGWVYLGTYHFEAGSSAESGSVQISNEGAAGKVVIADAIRFGNGMGDVPSGPSGIGTGRTVSGYPREDENALHWLYRAVGEGVSPTSVIGTSNVSAPARMAEHMNANSNPFGASVYIGFHSNAGGGRGAVGLMTNSASLRTPHQADLALYTGRQINQDMYALNGQFEHDWILRTTHTYAGINFGEIDDPDFTNSSNVVEMDATIIEVAFHDNAQDAELMRDPEVRDQLARSTYEATLEYFDNWGGLNNPAAVPSAPINVSALSQASGEVTLSWSAGPTGIRGGAPTGYRVYASTNGYGFDGGTLVAGGAASSVTLAGYDPTLPYYFKVVAVNAGGESHGSEVVTALPARGEKQVLVVNGFDRFDRTQNFRYPYLGQQVDRVWSRYNNSFDYVVQVHSAIHAAKPGVRVDSASNDAVISGAVNLEDYDAVIWILGNESTADDTFNATEQAKVEQFIAAGGHLFVSGAEIGWDLEAQGNGLSFYQQTLKGDYLADDAGTYTVSPAAGGIFAGLSSFGFSNGSTFSSSTSDVYNVAFPDVISPQAGGQLALNYSGGSGGGAAIQVAGADGRGSVVMFGFPFETITSAANRAAVVGRVLEFFDVTAIAPASADFDANGVVDGADFLAWQRGFGSANPGLADGDADGSGTVDGADLNTWSNQFGSESATASSVAFSTSAGLTAADESSSVNPVVGWVATGLSWTSVEPSATHPLVETASVQVRRRADVRRSAADVNPPAVGLGHELRATTRRLSLARSGPPELLAADTALAGLADWNWRTPTE